MRSEAPQWAKPQSSNAVAPATRLASVGAPSSTTISVREKLLSCTISSVSNYSCKDQKKCSIVLPFSDQNDRRKTQ